MSCQSLYTTLQFAVVRDGTSMTGIAERSRRTGVAFVNGVGAGWCADDLAEWLAGPYRKAIRVPEDMKSADGSLGPGPFGELMQEVTRARGSVVSFVRHLSTIPERVPFVENAITSGLVVPCESDDETGWIATWKRGASMRHLVAALFVADYLIRPTEYREELAICPTCDALLFDATSRARGSCGMHDEAPPVRQLPRLSPVPAPVPRIATPVHNTRRMRSLGTMIGMGTLGQR